MIRSIGYAGACAAALAGCGGGDFGDFFQPQAGYDAGRTIFEAGASHDANQNPGSNAGDDAHPGAPPPSTTDGARPDGSTPTTDAASDASSPGAPIDASSEIIEKDATLDAIADAEDPSGPLQRQRWEMPCAKTLPNDPSLCSTEPSGMSGCPGGYRPVEKSLTFGGSFGTHYSVSLRVRGVVELKSYAGGAAVGAHFLVGGAPSSGSINAYGLSVSSPRQTYYINADRSGSGASIAVVDDTVTIPIDGGATVELFATDGDCIQLRNCIDRNAPVCTPYVVFGVPPAPMPFPGQFAQLDVLSLAAMP